MNQKSITTKITSKTKYRNPTGYSIDFDKLEEFESCLDPLSPENCRIPCRVLGYGEISTVFEIDVEKMEGLAFKRMSIFEDPQEMGEYLGTYLEYNRTLEEDVGVHLPSHGYAAFVNETGRPIFYIIQRKLPVPSIGSKALHLLDRTDIVILFQCVLRELSKVWRFNCQHDRCEMGIDGQISNWVIDDFNPQDPYLDEDVCLLYVDTSTPMMRINGVEQMDMELLLRAAPSFLAWILRLLFMQDVVDRYYDFRLVVIDLLANFYKEQKTELIPALIIITNDFFAGEAADLEVEPIDEDEVRAYYREDAFIWSFYLSARRLDRFLHHNVLGREYPYILPGRIKR